jgi:LL-diaminopimelate aminotransferase
MSNLGNKEIMAKNIRYYMDNVQILKQGLSGFGLKVAGGDNAPYLWVQVPKGMSSWKFFDKLLYEAHIVGTPGVGFGPSGEGYMRFTGFGKKEHCMEAIQRLRRCL